MTEGGRTDDTLGITNRRVATPPWCDNGFSGTVIYKLGFSGLNYIQRVCHLSEPSAAPFPKHGSRYQFLYLLSKIFLSRIWGCSPSEESSTMILSCLLSEIHSTNPPPQPWAQEMRQNTASQGVSHHHREKGPLPSVLTAPAPVQLPLTSPSARGDLLPNLWLPVYPQASPPYSLHHTSASQRLSLTRLWLWHSGLNIQ